VLIFRLRLDLLLLLDCRPNFVACSWMAYRLISI
jgi:hypothetical protein